MPGASNGSKNHQKGSCSHLDSSEESLKRYKLGLRWGKKIKRGEVRRDDEDEDNQDRYNDPKRRKLLAHPSCTYCQSTLHRPFVCLDCALPACFYTQIEGNKDCIRHHLQDSRHHTAFDLYDGTIYCLKCDDVVYDARFQEALSIEQRRASGTGGSRTSAGQITSGDKKEGGPSICRVPRGLYNLGASCFMNVILQSFVQNPLLRNYFLSDRHHAALCPARENCLACELDKLFTEFYSEKPQVAPYAPTNFLFCIYLARESTEVSTGAGEHDAHELFISALNNVHSALMAVGREPSTRSSRLPMYPFGDQAYGLTASRSGTASNASDDDDQTFRFNSDIVCPCVVHRTFAGVLQSDVTCQRCGWTSTAYDPFLDLSLDIRTNRARAMSLVVDTDTHEATKKKSKKGKDHSAKDKALLDALNGKAGADDEQSLTDCMRRYCAMEKLGQSDYSCHQCGVGSSAVKQLTLCRLPPVLCFQLKRFEHNATTGTKIETRIKFSLTFDVREYCTNASLHDEDQDQSSEKKNKVDPDSYIYDLFTVIVHEGKLNTGHYYCYFRWRDNWYVANDDSTKLATLQDVLGCRAYQLCYLRRGLQNIRPS